MGQDILQGKIEDLHIGQVKWLAKEIKSSMGKDSVPYTMLKHELDRRGGSKSMFKRKIAFKMLALIFRWYPTLKVEVGVARLKVSIDAIVPPRIGQE